MIRSRPVVPLAATLAVLLSLVAGVVGHPRPAGSLLLVALAALVAWWRLRFAVLLAIPAFLWVHPLPSTLPSAGAITVGLVLGALARGHLPAVLRRWRVLASAAAFAGWMVFCERFPATSGAADVTTTKGTISIVAGVVLLALAAADPPSRRAVERAAIVFGSASGIAAFLWGTAYDLDNRVIVFGQNPDYLVLPFVLGLVACGVALRRGQVLLVALSLPGLVTGLVLTQSRGGLLAFGAGLVAVVIGWFILRRPHRFSPRIDVAVMCAFLVIGVGAVVVPTLGLGGGGFGRSGAQLEKNNTTRMGAAGLAYHLAKAHPIRGVGVGRFAVIAAADPDLHIYISTHNDYLRFAAEAGFVGLGLFTIAIAVVVLRPGLEDLDEAAIPFAFLVGMLFVNVLAPLPISGALWVYLGARLGRSTGAPKWRVERS